MGCSSHEKQIWTRRRNPKDCQTPIYVREKLHCGAPQWCERRLESPHEYYSCKYHQPLAIVWDPRSTVIKLIRCLIIDPNCSSDSSVQKTDCIFGGILLLPLFVPTGNDSIPKSVDFHGYLDGLGDEIRINPKKPQIYIYIYNMCFLWNHKSSSDKSKVHWILLNPP